MTVQVQGGVIYGQGAPTNDIGFNGQIYQDTATGKTYEKNMSGVWEEDVAGGSTYINENSADAYTDKTLVVSNGVVLSGVLTRCVVVGLGALTLANNTEYCSISAQTLTVDATSHRVHSYANIQASSLTTSGSLSITFSNSNVGVGYELVASSNFVFNNCDLNVNSLIMNGSGINILAQRTNARIISLTTQLSDQTFVTDTSTVTIGRASIINGEIGKVLHVGEKSFVKISTYIHEANADDQLLGIAFTGITSQTSNLEIGFMKSSNPSYGIIKSFRSSVGGSASVGVITIADCAAQLHVTGGTFSSYTRNINIDGGGMAIGMVGTTPTMYGW